MEICENFTLILLIMLVINHTVTNDFIVFSYTFQLNLVLVFWHVSVVAMLPGKFPTIRKIGGKQ